MPSAVRNLSVVEYSRDYVDLSWQCPEDDGGSPVVQYIVEKCDVTRPAGAIWTHGGTVAASKASIRAGELLEGNSYLFRVFAENRAGRGQPTVLREPVIPIGMPYYFCCINSSFTNMVQR